MVMGKDGMRLIDDVEHGLSSGGLCCHDIEPSRQAEIVVQVKRGAMALELLREVDDCWNIYDDHDLLDKIEALLADP